MYLAAQLRVLCIDDTQETLNVMGSILRRAGHQVHLVLGGEAGIGMLQQLPSIDVVLINNRMPGLSGMEVVEFLAANRRYDSIGVVFHSAVDTPELPTEHARWGRVDVCLTLPFQPLDLLDAVFTAYMRRRGFQHRITYVAS